MTGEFRFVVDVGEEFADTRCEFLEEALEIAKEAAKTRRMVFLFIEWHTHLILLRVWEDGK